MVTTQVVKWLSTGERRLLNWNRRGVLSALSFTDSGGVRYFDRAWLRKSHGDCGGQQGECSTKGSILFFRGLVRRGG